MSINHPNAVITRNLSKLLTEYDEENQMKLIEYLVEWTAQFSLTKHPIELIRETIERNLYMQDYSKREATTYEFQKIFRMNASTPESFMEGLLVEDWPLFKDQFEGRSQNEKAYVKDKIEKAISEIGNIHLPSDHRDKYK